MRDGNTKPADWIDNEGHGASRAGILAALNNDIGLAGAGRQANLWAVRILDDDSSGCVSDAIRGQESRVEKGSEVVSMRFAGSDSESVPGACQMAADAYRV